MPVVGVEVAGRVVDDCHEEGDGDEEEADGGQRVGHGRGYGRALRCGAWSIHVHISLEENIERGEEL